MKTITFDLFDKDSKEFLESKTYEYMSDKSVAYTLFFRDFPNYRDYLISTRTENETSQRN